MKSYPDPITPDLLPKYAHISDDEVRRDIADTEAEIPVDEQLAAANEVVARSHHSDAERRLADFRTTGYRQRNAQRRQFIAFLHRLLAARQAPA